MKKLNIIKAETISFDTLFVPAEIYVMYVGYNRKGMYISKESVERSIHTLANIPIVGQYDEYNQNFLGHQTALGVTLDGDLKYERGTVPLGLVPESFTHRWEEVIHSDGTVREYLVVSALIWNRDLDITKDLLFNNYGQSMEIAIDRSINKNGYVEVQDFHFEALCVLGIDKGQGGHVEPAFEGAKIEVFSQEGVYLSNVEKMLRDFQQYTLNERGMELNLEEALAKFNVSKEKLLEVAPNHQELSEEELSALFSNDQVDEAEAETKTAEDVAEEEAEKAEEEATEEVTEETEAEDAPEAETEEESKEAEATEPEATEETAEEADEEAKEEEAEEQAEDEAATEETPVDVAQFELTIAELQNKVFELEQENLQLKQERHNRDCQEFVAKFTSTYKLDEVLLEELKFEQFSNVEQLESKLYEILGRTLKDSAKAQAPTEVEAPKVEVFNLEDRTTDNSLSEYSFAEYFNLK